MDASVGRSAHEDAVELLVHEGAHIPDSIEPLTRALELALRHVRGTDAISATVDLVARGIGVVIVLPDALLRDGTGRRLLDAGAHDLLAAEDPALAPLLDEAVEGVRLRARRARTLAHAGLLGDSRVMRRVRSTLAEALADATIPVLLLGETGTGKYLAARALHAADASRAGEPFHAIDCGVVTDTLFGSELFGHVRGAFTGALEGRAGAIASAGAGTLLLDEVGELTPVVQATLLTALQERVFRAVGSDAPRAVRCRVVAATNRDLDARTAAGSFRADLLHRLDGVRVRLPTLAERPEDVPALFEALVRRHRALARDAEDVRVEPQVQALLAERAWPGNVRELETVARRCAAAAGRTGRVRLAHVAHLVEPARVPIDVSIVPRPGTGVQPPIVSELVASGLTLEQIVALIGREAIECATAIAARARPASSRTQVVHAAAQLLHVSPRFVWKRLGERTGSGGMS